MRYCGTCWVQHCVVVCDAQVENEHPLTDQSTHIANIGRMVEVSFDLSYLIFEIKN